MQIVGGESCARERARHSSKLGGSRAALRGVDCAGARGDVVATGPAQVPKGYKHE